MKDMQHVLTVTVALGNIEEEEEREERVHEVFSALLFAHVFPYKTTPSIYHA